MTLERWFYQKYKLPPNHRLFTTRTEPDLLVEFLRDKDSEREALRLELPKIKDHAYRQSVVKQISLLDEMLDGVTSNGEQGDKLVEYWEHCLEAGIDPDLDMTVEDLK